MSTEPEKAANWSALDTKNQVGSQEKRRWPTIRSSGAASAELKNPQTNSTSAR